MPTNATPSVRCGEGLGAWPLLVVLLFPTVPLYMDIASSLALGTMIASTLLVFRIWSQGLSRSSGAALLSSIILVMVVVITHSVLVSLRLPFDFGRAGASLAPLLLVLMGGHALSQIVARASGREIDGAVHVSFIILCLVAIAGVAGLAPTTTRLVNKPVFPFTEPSHFALAFVPLLMYRCLMTTTLRRVVLIAGALIVAALLENLTLIAGCFLVAIVSLRLYQLVFASVIVAAIAFGMQIDLAYYAERLDITTESQNISSLAYLQGWQLIVESWSQTEGMGIGFQQLGVQGTSVDAAELIEILAGTPLNLYDGSFTASKLVSEFGVVGGLLTLGYFVVATRSVLFLKQNALCPRALVAHCMLVSYGLEFCLRGSGYFTGNVVLLVAALWLLIGSRKIRRGSTASTLLPRSSDG